MKKLNVILTAFAFCMAPALTVSCEKDYSSITNPTEKEKVIPSESLAPNYKWDKVADSVSTAFIERFFCSETRNGATHVFSYSDYNRRGGNFNCYWQQAHGMAVMVDYYQRIKDTRPEEADVLKLYMSQWYDKRANNYEWNLNYRGSTGFGNDFTDDTCWIIISLIQMFEATGEQKYFDAAKQTWDECVRPRFALTKYGWLPWKWSNMLINECTNGPGAIVAVTLAKYALESGNQAEYEQYLKEAYSCYDALLSMMKPVGTIGTTPLSYTQGTGMEAARLIWHLTGDEGYIRKGILVARGQMNAGMNEKYNGETVMRNEGEDDNNSIFHAVFYHWAARMAADKAIDAIDPDIREELCNYIKRHAVIYWTKGIDKSLGGWASSYFSTRVYRPRAVGTGGSLGAYASAAQAMESMNLISGETF